jgi:protein-S-isoprenylcysteine O-methyltransferase Ste14
MEANEKDRPRVIARPPLIYLGFLLFGFGLDWLWPLALLPEVVQYFVGAALIALGVLVTGLAFRRFKAVGTNVPTPLPTTVIVTDGPYRASRNPIYLGLTAIYAGIGIAADAPWVLALIIPLLVVMRVGVIAREERYLERKFGAEYLRYKASVRRWM